VAALLVGLAHRAVRAPDVDDVELAGQVALGGVGLLGALGEQDRHARVVPQLEAAAGHVERGRPARLGLVLDLVAVGADPRRALLEREAVLPAVGSGERDEQEGRAPQLVIVEVVGLREQLGRVGDGACAALGGDRVRDAGAAELGQVGRAEHQPVGRCVRMVGAASVGGDGHG
jgi:hypothetical protein